MGAGRLIVFIMREVRADNQQRLIGPNLSDSCGNGTGRCETEKQRNDRQITVNRLQKRQFDFNRVVALVRRIIYYSMTLNEQPLHGDSVDRQLAKRG